MHNFSIVFYFKCGKLSQRQVVLNSLIIINLYSYILTCCVCSKRPVRSYFSCYILAIMFCWPADLYLHYIIIIVRTNLQNHSFRTDCQNKLCFSFSINSYRTLNDEVSWISIYIIPNLYPYQLFFVIINVVINKAWLFRCVCTSLITSERGKYCTIHTKDAKLQFVIINFLGVAVSAEEFTRFGWSVVS